MNFLHYSRLKAALLTIYLVILYGCATRGIQHHVEAYKACVRSQAMARINTSDSAEELTRLASAQCQGNLGIIAVKLREDNAWVENHGLNADTYTETLRDRTSVEVAEEIRKIRQGTVPVE